MTPRMRSVSGAVMAILMIPLLAGLLACLPVPIGDPERSRVDDEKTGLWFKLQPDDEPWVVLYEPWDKRTWLVTLYTYEVAGESCEPQDEEAETYEEVMAELRQLGKKCLKRDEHGTYKVWRKKIGDTWFQTWEIKGAYDKNAGFDTEVWLGFKEAVTSSNEFSLSMINGDHSVFNELDENRSYQKLTDQGFPYDPRTLRSASRAMERILRKNLDNEDILAEDPMTFYRIDPGDYSLFLGNIVPQND